MTPPKESADLDEISYDLEEEEVAYVFGRMGTTKDKLARVSGTRIELRGSSLVIQGTKKKVKVAKHLVKILLDQREGTVNLDPKEHPDNLTLLDVPTSCKGFITGKGGNTLRQIERECATLMTFCKEEDNDNEPLAIFGTRRGRLTAQMKIMSIVEGKCENWFCKDGDHPEVQILDVDATDGDWDVEYVKLERDMLGYALGKGGDTRIKLAVASACVIQYIGLWAAFGGRKKDRERGMTYLAWLIDQRNMDFKVDISSRDDVSCLWVPEPSVGYVTGRKAKTLRNLESKTGTFCFFDKRKSGRSKEKMLLFAGNPAHRKAAVEEVHTIVDFHQRKIGGNGRACSTYGSESRSKSRSHSKDSRSKSRGRSKDSGSRSRSKERTEVKKEARNSRSRSQAKKSRSRSRSNERVRVKKEARNSRSRSRSKERTKVKKEKARKSRSRSKSKSRSRSRSRS